LNQARFDSDTAERATTGLFCRPKPAHEPVYGFGKQNPSCCQYRAVNAGGAGRVVQVEGTAPRRAGQYRNFDGAAVKRGRHKHAVRRRD
jgi:hypothetical protein